ESLSRQNSAGFLEICRTFKGIICDDISEFESYVPSHAVWSLRERPGSELATLANAVTRKAARQTCYLASASGRGCVPWAIALVRDRRLGVRRVCRVLLDAADEIERGVQRLVVLRIRRDIGTESRSAPLGQCSLSDIHGQLGHP